MRKGSKQGARIDGQAVQKMDKPLVEVAEEFIKIKEATGRAPQTIRTYRYQLRYFLEYAGEDIKCSELTLDKLTGYLDHLRSRGITNPVTLNTAIQNLSPIVHYARERGYCPHQYLMPFIKGQQVDKPPYTQEELDKLLEPPGKQDFKSIRTWAIIWTLASTGIRARELRELRVENVDFANMVIHLQRTKSKKPRRIPMSADLFEVLTIWRRTRRADEAEPGDPFFCTIYGDVMETTTLSDSVREWTQARGVVRENTGGLHIFRHTFITEAVRTGVSSVMLQRITGHSTEKQLAHYYHERVEDMRQIIDTITPKKQPPKRRRFD